MARIYPRGGTFWFDVTFRGVRYRESAHTSNRRTAEQVLAAFRTALAKGEVGIIERKQAPVFRSFWQEALDQIKADLPEDSRTVAWYETSFKKSLDFTPLARARLDEIDEELLSRYRKHLIEKEELSAPTVNGRLRAIRRALYVAQSWKRITHVPSFPMMSEKGHGREFILTPALRSEFLNRSPEKFRMIFEFLLETGLRISECVKLTWDRVFVDQLGEFGRPFIYIRPDREQEVSIKSKRSRKVPLFDRALAIVASQEKISKSQFVFVQYGARVRKDRQYRAPFSRHDVSSMFRKIAREMGLPKDAVLHSTRHTMLTELGTAGADASTIQLVAGHEDIRTSQKYLHPTPEHVLRAFERMHAIRASQTPSPMPALVVASRNRPKWHRHGTNPGTVAGEQVDGVSEVVENKRCESGGIGRRTRLRIGVTHAGNCHSKLLKPAPIAGFSRSVFRQSPRCWGNDFREIKSQVV